MKASTTGLAVLFLLALGLTACTPGTSPVPSQTATAAPPAAASSTLAEAPTPTATPRGGAPALEEVDRSSPEAVGDAFVITAWTMDTQTDSGPAAAQARCAGLATSDLAAQLTATRPQSTTSEWATWAAHRAYTTVELAPDYDTRPEDTPTTAYRAWTVTVRPQAPGWTGKPWHLTVFITMTKTAGWAVSDWKVS